MNPLVCTTEYSNPVQIWVRAILATAWFEPIKLRRVAIVHAEPVDTLIKLEILAFEDVEGVSNAPFVRILQCWKVSLCILKSCYRSRLRACCRFTLLLARRRFIYVRCRNHFEVLNEHCRGTARANRPCCTRRIDRKARANSSISSISLANIHSSEPAEVPSEGNSNVCKSCRFISQM